MRLVCLIPNSIHQKKLIFESMNWEDIVGQQNIVTTLKDTVDKNRVSHAQLFVGEEGYGILPLALAYAKEILKEKTKMPVPK